ncbi:hypothetical protein [Mycobacterium sp.]|uniref:hypothetical protein n=1 Tax=Mycobacterium sp. TaxID=1785 RepID=UPI003C776C28
MSRIPLTSIEEHRDDTFGAAHVAFGDEAFTELLMIIAATTGWHWCSTRRTSMSTPPQDSNPDRRSEVAATRPYAATTDQPASRTYEHRRPARAHPGRR